MNPRARGYRCLRRLPSEARDLVEAALHDGWVLLPGGALLRLNHTATGRNVTLRPDQCGKAELAFLRRVVGARPPGRL